MAKKYPAIGCKKKPRNAGGLPCIICGVQTTGKVDIEVSWFRGDDEQVRVCAEHQSKNDAAILKAYIANFEREA
jgi:hypothetical protein